MGLLPKDFWELRPVDWRAMKKGYFRKVERNWDYTRHIMAAMGAGKGNPKKIIKLSFDQPAHAPSLEQAHTIAANLRKHLPKTGGG